ncbi:MAG: HAMP domain-containing histidine kinase [Deltaproteobacteria bacterium]|nr:HAMP domain-containing histidine kinase [Deltaproteobacteria bacterium]
MRRNLLTERWQSRLSYKFWWLDVLYPLLLSLLLFSGLTYLFYTGQKHRRVSSKLEERLISFSLRMASPRTLPNHASVMTLSVRESDLPATQSFHFKDYTDVSETTYVTSLNRLLDLGAEKIFINWQPVPELGESIYLNMMPVLLKAQGMGRDIYWAVQPKFVKDIPAWFQDYAVILEADPCQVSTQLICVYNEAWTKWLMQVIPLLLWKKREKGWGQGLVVSQNLPRLFPGYILYYNDSKEIPDLSYLELLSQEYLPAKTVFVGTDFIQGREGMSQPSSIGRVKSIIDDPNLSTRTGGTPLHKFWAQHAQLFIDDDLVGIIPLGLSFSFAVMVALLTIIILLRWGSIPSLGIFLVFAGLAPFANALMISKLRLYLPLFDCLYAGLSAFLLATFAKLSVESFYFWRIRIQQRSDQDILNARGNFISLVSHNLNTPVAKMLGLLANLEPAASKEHEKTELVNAQKLLATIQLSIRSVLMTTALEDKSLKQEALSLVALEKEFRVQMSKPLQRLGCLIELNISENELAAVPMRFDKRAVVSGWAALLLLIRQEAVPCHPQVGVEVKEDNDSLMLSFFLPCSLTLATKLQEFMQHAEGPDLLSQVSVNLLKSLLKFYQGRTLVDATGFTLQLIPFSQ